MLSAINPDHGHASRPGHGQGLAVSCVLARPGETEPALLAIADIVADHRPAPESAAARAAEALACLPGCLIFLAPDDRAPDDLDGYLAFTRNGSCFSIRRSRGRGGVPPTMAEACAVMLYESMLYASACADRVPPTAIVIPEVPGVPGPVIHRVW